MVGLSRLYTTRQNVVVNSHSVIGCHVRNIGSYIYYIVGIYMSSDIYYLLLLYLNRKELGRQLGSQTSSHDIFVKLSRLDVCLQAHSPASLLSPLV